MNEFVRPIAKLDARARATGVFNSPRDAGRITTPETGFRATVGPNRHRITVYALLP